jgi:hypothetical protein
VHILKYEQGKTHSIDLTNIFRKIPRRVAAFRETLFFETRFGVDHANCHRSGLPRTCPSNPKA